MPLEPGTELGPYRITGPLGAGGMGEVYRATDTKLHRDVAIKVLPEAFASDEQRMKRFEREAQVLASLNHPNIAAIYGLGSHQPERSAERSGVAEREVVGVGPRDTEESPVHYLVLELVEGPTLAERIREGPIPLEEALAIARQIIEAVSEAHEKGIVHRDLKPANVKLTEADQVKVLDFGLAKALGDVDGAETDGELSQSPTLTRQATMAGMILGTAAYMSPEQAKGKQVDRRTDVWAFGAVLYEMLTGKRAFEGEDVSETLAAVLRAQPDLDALPNGTPVAIRRLLTRIFLKNPRERLRDIADARFEIDEALVGADEISAGPGTLAASHRFGFAIAGLLLGAIATFLLMRNAPVAETVTHFTVSDQSEPPFSGMAWSPDGRVLVYSAVLNGTQRLFRKDLADSESTALPGTDGAVNPFFSPDGKSLGFFADNSLKTMTVAGGPANTLCPAGFRYGASWGEDGTIVFASNENPSLMRIPASGGVPVPVTKPSGADFHAWPEFLPGGRAVLFTISQGGPVSDKRIAVLDLYTGEERIILDGTGARYASSGHLVFGREDSLWAAPFDVESLSVEGDAVRIIENARVNRGGGQAVFALSRDGSLAYETGGASELVLNLVDPDGDVRPLIDRIGLFGSPRFSPDGSRVTVELDEDIWMVDTSRGALSRVTVGGGQQPVWTPDGTRITFVRENAIYTRRADGSGEPELLYTQGSGGRPVRLGNWTPDGSTLLFSTFSSPSSLYALSAGEVTEFHPSVFNERMPELSPDGRWLLYASNETGAMNVHLEPYPGPGERFRVSLVTGTQPSWSSDGREIYFREEGDLMVAAFDEKASPPVGTPRVHIAGEAGPISGSSVVRYYDPSPDGRSFAMVDEPGEGDRELHIILNWLTELEERVPSGR